jgi:hypothetical protein
MSSLSAELRRFFEAFLIRQPAAAEFAARVQIVGGSRSAKLKPQTII